MFTFRQRALAELLSIDEDCLSLKRREALVRAHGRKLLARYHPDRNPGNVEAEALFKVLVTLLGELPHILPEWKSVSADVVKDPRSSSTGSKETHSSLYYAPFDAPPPRRPDSDPLYTRALEEIEGARFETKGLYYDSRRGLISRSHHAGARRR